MSYLIHLSQSAFDEIRSKLEELGVDCVRDEQLDLCLKLDGVTAFPPSAPKVLKIEREGYSHNEATIIRIVADVLGVDELTLSRETDIVNDLGADSLDLVELVMYIEDELLIELSDDELTTQFKKSYAIQTIFDLSGIKALE